MPKTDPLLVDLDASLETFTHRLTPLPMGSSSKATEPPRARDLEEIQSDHLSSASSDLDQPSETEDEEEGQLPKDRQQLDQGSDSASAGGYSPPAWRRLDNGDRSSGFWRGGRDELGAVPVTVGEGLSRESSMDLERYYGDSEDEGKDGRRRGSENVLRRAIRTRLPTGSLSPEKGRSESPEKQEDPTLRPGDLRLTNEPSKTPPSDNYFRFALQAEVQQRTEPIETVVTFIRSHYARITASRTSLLTSFSLLLLTIFSLRMLFSSPDPLPAGDLVKVAGVAMSFEPLIYYSEHAVAQVHDLQATSVAVWDLGESVRMSDMKDAESIVADLDALSETMKTLAIEMTRFFARVDGDIDGILNVMDWAKMHLNRLNNAPPPSPLSSAYDNIHAILSSAHLLEDDAGSPTPLGSAASLIFGPSNPQRHQRSVQLVFTEFLSVLESSITDELQHSVTLFALFEAVDAHFLNLARTVVREYSLQDELRADQLSGLWTRIWGPRHIELAKFEQNRMLLNNVREKTVRNKVVLVEHSGKLLSLKTSLDGLRAKLVSPLLRGRNSTMLTLEDQIRGISDVSEYLGAVRRQQRGKVMESLFASVPGRKYMIDHGASGVLGQMN